MLKFFAVVLLALHCNCQNVIEVRDGQVLRNQVGVSHLPLKTVSGVSNVVGLPALSHQFPVSSYLSSLPALNYGLNVNGLNLGYLNGLQRQVNIAPSVYSYSPYQHQNLLAIRQPHVQAVSVAQPAVAVARQAYSIAQPQAVIAARPHVVSTEAVRPVSAAIQQVGRTVEYRDVPHNEHPIVPQDIIVEPSDQPINIHFRSRSSTVRVSQEHQPGLVQDVEQTQSQDDPSKVIHEVVKPVIQEVREVIQPYRQVTQEVQPVVENVHRVVSSGEAVRQQYVAEQPLVRQVQAIRQVQPLSVAVAQPAISIAQPISYAQRAIHLAQPYAYGLNAINVVQPQIQAYQVAQPIVSSIVRQPVIHQSIGQPIIGYNRIVSEQVPSIAEVRQVNQGQVNQVRQVVNRQDQDNDYIKFSESD